MLEEIIVTLAERTKLFIVVISPPSMANPEYDSDVFLTQLLFVVSQYSSRPPYPTPACRYKGIPKRTERPANPYPLYVLQYPE